MEATPRVDCANAVDAVTTRTIAINVRFILIPRQLGNDPSDWEVEIT